MALPLGLAATLKHKGSAKEQKAFLREFLKKHKLKVKHEYVPHDIMAHFQPEHKKSLRAVGIKTKIQRHPHGAVRTSPRVETSMLAHELGHAKDFAKNKPWVKRLRLRARQFGPLAGIAGSTAAVGLGGEKGEKVAPAIAAAGSLPTLSQEAKATYHGTKEIARQQGWKKALKSLKRTGPAFGSYLALPAGMAFLTHQVLKKKKREKK